MLFDYIFLPLNVKFDCKSATSGRPVATGGPLAYMPKVNALLCELSEGSPLGDSPFLTYVETNKRITTGAPQGCKRA